MFILVVLKTSRVSIHYAHLRTILSDDMLDSTI